MFFDLYQTLDEVVQTLGINPADKSEIAEILNNNFTMYTPLNQPSAYISYADVVTFLPFIQKPSSNSKLNITVTRIPSGDMGSLRGVLTRNNVYAPNFAGCVINVYLIQRNVQECFEYFDNNYKDEKQISIGLMNSRQHRVRIRAANKNLIQVFVNKEPDRTFMRKLLSVLPILCPHLLTEALDTNNISTEAAVELLKAYGAKDLQTWQGILYTYISSLKLSERRKQLAIANVFSKLREKTIATKTSKVTGVTNLIDETEHLLESHYTELRQAQAELFALMNEPQNDLSETIDYLANHPCIEKLDAFGDKLYFRISAPVIYYEEEVAKRVLTNTHAQLYEYKNESDFPEILQALLNIFINKTATLYFQAEISVNIVNYEIRLGTTSPVCSHGIYNPHLKYFTCFGNSKSEIMKALKRQDFVVTAEQLIACVGNLNFLDGAVSGRFFRYICTRVEEVYDVKAIRCGDNWYTFREYIRQLKKDSEDTEPVVLETQDTNVVSADVFYAEAEDVDEDDFLEEDDN